MRILYITLLILYSYSSDVDSDKKFNKSNDGYTLNPAPLGKPMKHGKRNSAIVVRLSKFFEFQNYRPRIGQYLGDIKKWFEGVMKAYSMHLVLLLCMAKGLEGSLISMTFLLIVFAGYLSPDFIFVKGSLGILVYTLFILFGRYTFASIALALGYEPIYLYTEIGLIIPQLGSGDFIYFSTSSIISLLLGSCWKYRKKKSRNLLSVKIQKLSLFGIRFGTVKKTLGI